MKPARRSSPLSARRLAVEALLCVDDGKTAQQALSAVLDAYSTDVRDRHLASELTYGLLRNEGRVRFLLNRLLPRSADLPKAFLHILGLAVYTHIGLERIPFHAAVNEAVAEARFRFGSALAGVANGVLRALERLGTAVFSPSFYALPSDGDVRDPSVAKLIPWMRLARFHSLPLWIVRLWLAHYGSADTLCLIRRASSRPWRALRVNTCANGSERLYTALAACADGFRFRRCGVSGFVAAPEFPFPVVLGRCVDDWIADGLLSRQSCGSQSVLKALGFGMRRDRPVWDMCAGFGGKTAFLLERGITVALSTDISFSRLSLLGADCSRLALSSPPVALSDASRPAVRSFGGDMLLDVPCSGLGVLAGRPDIRRLRQTKRSIRLFPKTQEAILDAALSLLRPGCELAYVTCTLVPHENGRIIEGVLARDPGLECLRVWQSPNTCPWIEGMFGALLRRRF